MTSLDLGYYLKHFVKLNPRNYKYPNFEKYNQNSFFIIQNCFKENQKNIISTNYNGIFYNKKSGLIGKKWIDIFLSSKNIIEYHKKIRDEFPYCKQRKFTRILLDDLFFWLDKNTQNIMIQISEASFDIDISKKLEKIRFFLDNQDWSIYFFELQRLMHEQIIKFLSWNKNLNFNDYCNLFSKKMMFFLEQKRVTKYLDFIQKVNLYRNTLSKANSTNKENSKKLLNEWNGLTSLMKTIEAKHFYYDLLEFIDIINLLLNKKSI